MAKPTDYTIHERVCNVLEWLAMHEPEDLAVFTSQVYRYTHHANAPDCPHPDWWAEFEALEAGIWAAGGKIRGADNG